MLQCNRRNFATLRCEIARQDAMVERLAASKTLAKHCSEKLLMRYDVPSLLPELSALLGVIYLSRVV